MALPRVAFSQLIEEGRIAPLGFLAIAGFVVLILALALLFGPREWGPSIISILGDCIRFGFPLSAALSGFRAFIHNKNGTNGTSSLSTPIQPATGQQP